MAFQLAWPRYIVLASRRRPRHRSKSPSAQLAPERHGRPDWIAARPTEPDAAPCGGVAGGGGGPASGRGASRWTPGRVRAGLAAGAAVVSSGAGSTSAAARTVRAAKTARAEAAVARGASGRPPPPRGRDVLP